MSVLTSKALTTSPRCRAAFWQEAWFQARLQDLGLPTDRLHRKYFEMACIAQVYYERIGYEGTACGFGVAHEPIPAELAACGCDVLVSNIAADTPEGRAWAAGGQHATALEGLPYAHVLSRARFLARTRWRDVDMRTLPSDLGQFDLLWSSCALEHLGSRAAGLHFIIAAAQHLLPGGWAVHTTELNCSSTTHTIDSASTVLFVEPDLVWLGARLQQDGVTLLPLDLAPGTDPRDQIVDGPPYQGDVHLNVEYRGFTTTCVALIMTREG
jgi:hypothetical protein